MKDRELIEAHVKFVREETGCINWPIQLPDDDMDVLAAWSFVQGYAVALQLTSEELIEKYGLTKCAPR